MTTSTLTVTNALGMHARAAAKFVHRASAFASHIRVACGGREMDGKSIMGLLLLSAALNCWDLLKAIGNQRDHPSGW